jgi:hypothetical protein
MLERQLLANRNAIRLRRDRPPFRHFCHLPLFRAAFVRDVVGLRNEIRRRRSGRP